MGQTQWTRKEFADRVLDAEDLAAAARMWVDWFRMSGIHQGRPAVAGTLRAEVRFWGFARSEGAALLRAIEARVAARELPDPRARVMLSDADTLSVTRDELHLVPGVNSRLSGPADAERLAAQGVGEWLHAVAVSPATAGFCCQVRLTLDAVRGKSGVLGNTLVLVGLVRGGQFVFKCAYPTGATGEEEARFYQVAPWPEEAKLLAALHDYRNGVPNPDAEKLSKALFLKPSDASSSDGITRFVGISGDLLRGILVRATGAAGLAALSVALLAALPRPFSLIMLLPLVASAFGLCYLVVMVVRSVVGMYLRMNAGLRKAFAGPIAFPVAALEDADLASDPTLRKLFRELEDAGATHYRDVRADPPFVGDMIVRLFLLPDIPAVFSLMILRGIGEFRTFPGKPTFMLKTRLSNGTHLISNDSGGGYRAPLPEAGVVLRIFPQARDDVAQMIRLHRTALERLAAKGVRPLPLEPERIVPEMLEEHDRERAAYARHGYYTWDAAVRQTFQRPRREYLEP